MVELSEDKDSLEITLGTPLRQLDADDLYEKMRTFAHLSREERMAMGLAAREKMEREFDKNDVVRNSIQILFR